MLPALKECIQKHDHLYVIFDGCRGAGVSFLEESFGGLIRAGIPYKDAKDWMTIVWKSNPRKKAQADGFIEKAHYDKENGV